MSNKIYIYIDESGDLGKLGSKYFTIAALCTENPKPIENFIKKVKQRKLKKRLKELSEIKANNSDEIIRKYVLNGLVKQNCKFYILMITKEKVREYLYEKKHKLYNYIMGLLVDEVELLHRNIEIVIDKKDSNQLLKEDLNNYLNKKIEERKLLLNLTIIHKHSHDDKCLQAVDFVAWSANRKFSFDEEEYYKIIESKVASFKKLWD